MKLYLFISIILVLLAVPGLAGERRVSVLYIHYSVGGQMVRADCNIRDDLDTVIAIVGTDTARIVFREYYLNYERTYGITALSDTVHYNCQEQAFADFDYDLKKNVNRTIIWGRYSYPFAGLLNYLFDVPNRESYPFWNLFRRHNVPGTSGDSVSEKYDIVLVKNPYLSWAGMDPAASDSIKKFYSAVRDTVANNSEIHLGLLFGTPHRLGGDGVDTTQARISYELAT